MNRKVSAFISVIFALLMAVSLTVTSFASDNKLLYSDVDGFTAEEQKEVADYLAEKSEEFDCDLVCLCINSFKTYKDGKYTQNTIEEIANDYYSDNNIGRGQNGDAVIVLWVNDAETKLEGFKVYTFGKKYSEDDILPVYYELQAKYFEDREDSDNSDYYLRCMALANSFESIYEGEKYVVKVDDEGNSTVMHRDEYIKENYLENDSFNVLKYVVIALIIGVVVGLIVATSMKSSLKSVRKQSGASLYTVDESFKVDTQNDVFLYKKEEKTEKPKQQEQQNK